jgi:hypothetical protein
MAQRPGLTRKLAEAMAVQALTFLAEDSQRLQRFVAFTGIDPEEIRAAAQRPEFLAGVLDHLAADESLLIAFAEHARIDPLQVRRASHLLVPDGWERDVP